MTEPFGIDRPEVCHIPSAFLTRAEHAEIKPEEPEQEPEAGS